MNYRPVVNRYIPGKAIKDLMFERTSICRFRTGLERGSPEMDSETIVQALRGAAGAKLSQKAFLYGSSRFHKKVFSERNMKKGLGNARKREEETRSGYPFG